MVRITFAARPAKEKEEERRICANVFCRELFAKKKGILAKPKDGKLIYDDEKQEWVPKWGYKGKNKEVEDQWLVEIDTKKTTEEGTEENPRKLSRDERKKNIKLNERQAKKNALGKTEKMGVGKKRKQ